MEPVCQFPDFSASNSATVIERVQTVVAVEPDSGLDIA
jgi:hypothetical protein